MDQQKKVVLFSTPTCSWCTRTKRYFIQHQIRFTEVDVTRDKRAAQDIVRRTGQQGVPVILIGSQAIVGFNKSRIDRLLGIS
jgi:glutaredoxin 3